MILLTYDDFENGWGNYSDGGIDCSRYNGLNAPNGSYAIEIRDNTGDTSSFYYTAGRDVDTPGYTSIKIDFWFKTDGFSNNHNFYIEYWNGSAYTIVENLICGTHFTDGSVYNKIIWINESELPSYVFPIDMKIKFRCDAQNDGDKAYIDEIYVYVI